MTDLTRLIIGIDPGLTTGFASYAPETDEVISAVTLYTRPSDGSDADRLTKLARGLSLLLPMPEGMQVTLAIEVQHARSGPHAAKLSADTMRGPAAVRGMLMFLADQRGWKVVEVQPADANRALSGVSNPSGKQMVAMALQRYGVKCSQHAADAVGFALAGDAREKEDHT